MTELRKRFKEETGYICDVYPMKYAEWLEDQLQSVEVKFVALKMDVQYALDEYKL